MLDEPTVGLDPDSRAAVWREIRLLRDRGTTVLLCTHYLEEAEQLADRLGIMHRGRLAARGTATELKDAVKDSASAATLEQVFLALTGNSFWSLVLHS